jgi:molybdopterin synthase sulfur carrier subunit
LRLGEIPLKVTVDYLGHIRGIIGVDATEDVQLQSDASVFVLLNILAKKHGAPFQEAVYESNASDLKPAVILTVNGFLLNQLKGLDTQLKDGDKIVIMPVVSGG